MHVSTPKRSNCSKLHDLGEGVVGGIVVYVMFRGFTLCHIIVELLTR